MLRTRVWFQIIELIIYYLLLYHIKTNSLKWRSGSKDEDENCEDEAVDPNVTMNDRMQDADEEDEELPDELNTVVEDSDDDINIPLVINIMDEEGNEILCNTWAYSSREYSHEISKVYWLLVSYMYTKFWNYKISGITLSADYCRDILPFYANK